MKKIITAFSLCAVLAFFSAFAFFQSKMNAVQDTDHRSTPDVHGGLHSIYELNSEDDVLDSHSGVTSVSTLELDYRNSYFIKSSELTDSGNVWYPRIKRLSDGSYILFFQDGKYGPNIYFTRSIDGYRWDEPTVLFEKHLTNDNRYWRYYATCDAIELENGSIVAAAIFHANRRTNDDIPSRWLMSEKGIVTKLSKDGGKTWSDQQEIYNGRCWEPSLLQLPDGTVQLYFTQSAPKDAIYNSAMGSHVSSGVGLISSNDNGESWTPIVTEYPYVTSRIAQQYIYTNENGIKIMTDQMPVAILLHDRKTVVMAVESLVSQGTVHNTSIIRSHDFFKTALSEDETGPYDRDNMLLPGPAPYIVQFPSGEIAVSNLKKVYLGNELATEFYSDRSFNLYPHQSNAIWGCMFVSDSHVLLASAADIAETKSNGIGVSRLILNHRIDAKASTVNIDADTSDWFDNTDALFVGSIDQAQASIRVSHDSGNVYFLFEQLDYYITSEDYFVFSAKAENSDAKLIATVNADGMVKLEHIKNGKTTKISDYLCKTKIYGTKDSNTDRDEGVVIEISVPKSYLDNSSNLRVFMKMYGNDGGKTFSWDGFNGASESNSSTWHMVRLSSKTADTLPPDDTTSLLPTDTEQTAALSDSSVTSGYDKQEIESNNVGTAAVIICAVAVIGACIILRLRAKKE